MDGIRTEETVIKLGGDKHHKRLTRTENLIGVIDEKDTVVTKNLV